MTHAQDLDGFDLRLQKDDGGAEHDVLDEVDEYESIGIGDGHDERLEFSVVNSTVALLILPAVEFSLTATFCRPGLVGGSLGGVDGQNA